MALFSKPSASERRFDGGDIVTIVGPEATFNGVLTPRGSLRVEGRVEGNVNDAQSVFVAKGGSIRGDVAAETVEVAGEIVGDVTASERIDLDRDGRIVGTIRTKTLHIEEGAVFDGRCVMGGGPDEPDAGPREEAAEKAAS